MNASSSSRLSHETQTRPSSPSSSVSSHMPADRDWEAAYASLQSSFGFSGGAPCIPSFPSAPKSKKSSSAKSKSKAKEVVKSSEDKFGLGLGHIIPVHHNAL